MRSLALLLASLSLACIERPVSPTARADSFPRAGLEDVLMSEAPRPRVPVGARFDGLVELVGYDFTPTSVKGGDTVTVTFWWKALEYVGDDWTVFVHLEDETRTNPRRNADHAPARGRYPTGVWRPGEVVKDEWTFTAPTAGPGLIQLWTGLYIDERRMPVEKAGRGRSDKSNRVRAGAITVQ